MTAPRTVPTSRMIVYDLVKALVVAPLTTCLMTAAIAAAVTLLAPAGDRATATGAALVGFVFGAVLFAPLGVLVLGGGLLAVRLGVARTPVRAVVTTIAVLVTAGTWGLLGSGGGLATSVETAALAAGSSVGVGLVVWLFAGWMLRPHGTAAAVPPAPTFAVDRAR